MATAPDGGWAFDGPGSFSANGHEGQYSGLVPELDLILVRNGESPLEQKNEVMGWMGEVAECFRG